jgi:hypothetical protein
VQRRAGIAAGAERPGIEEPVVQPAVDVEPAKVLRGRDRQHGERGAEGRLADLAVVHAVAGTGQGLVIADESRPVGQLAVVAGIEPEHGAGSRDGDSTLAGDRSADEDQGEEYGCAGRHVGEFGSGIR